MFDFEEFFASAFEKQKCNELEILASTVTASIQDSFDSRSFLCGTACGSDMQGGKDNGRRTAEKLEVFDFIEVAAEFEPRKTAGLGAKGIASGSRGVACGMHLSPAAALGVKHINHIT